MNNFLTPVLKSFDRALRGVVIAMVLAVVLIGAAQVFCRYVLGASLIWAEEASRMLLIWLVLIGASIEVERGTNLAVTYLVDMLKTAPRQWLDRICALLVFAFGLVLAIAGTKLAMTTMDQSLNTLPFAMGQVYLALPVGGVLISLNALRVLVRPDRSETIRT